ARAPPSRNADRAADARHLRRPSGCDSRECRRRGACRAEDPCEPACGTGWTQELVGRFSDMVAGISLSALCIEREAEASRDALARHLGIAAGRGKRERKPPGRSKRAKPLAGP